MDIPPSYSAGNVIPSSSHRLPTVSASQALQNIQARGPRAISTGLTQLDALLDATNVRYPGRPVNGGGFTRGKIAEVWGPSGSGKTSLAMQATANVLNSGESVVWVDATASLSRPRLKDMLAASASSTSSSDTAGDYADKMSRFHAYFAPTVAHVLALTLHPPPSFPPPGTALMVIDGLHTIFEIAYPRHRANTFSGNKSDAAKWTAGRRYGILASLISALKKLAALTDIAIIVTTGCATRGRSGGGLGAVLVPGLGGAEWEAGITNRLVMFRDFSQGGLSQHQQQHGGSARYVGLQKVNGVAFSDEGETGQLLTLTIDKTGLRDVDSDTTKVAPVVALAVSSPIKGRKRAYGEIADPDAQEGRDEYGWLNGDEVAAEGLIDEEALVDSDTGVVLVDD